MIKEALAYLNREAVKANEVQIFEDKYKKQYLCVNGDYEEVVKTRAYPISLHYLDGLIEYVNKKVDGYEQKDLIIVIKSPTSVRLLSGLDETNRREHPIEVDCITTKFKFNEWYLHEQFVINLMSMFIPTEDLEYLIKTVSNINLDNGIEHSDDGVSQRVSVKKGITTMEKEFVKARVTLKPIRTFKEIAQPESDFIFRIKVDHGGCLECALFEADGELWKLDAIKSTKAYLRSNIVSSEDHKIDILM